MRSLSKLCVLLLAAGLLIAPASGAAASKSKKKKSKTEEVTKPKVDKYTKIVPHRQRAFPDAPQAQGKALRGGPPQDDRP